MRPHLEEAWRALRLADRDVALVSLEEAARWVNLVQVWAENEVRARTQEPT